MAETLSEFLKSSDGEGKTVLVFAGSGHVAFGFGIPKRFYRRTSIPYQIIVLKVWKEKIDEDFTFTPLEIMPRCSAAGLDFRIIPGSAPEGVPPRRAGFIPFRDKSLTGFNAPLEFLTGFTETSSPPANFLWITRPNPPEKKQPRIGVVLKQKEDQKGLWIERVIPDSPAEKAGLLSGDQFIAVEGKEIGKVKDIHNALAQKGWGKEITFTIVREGKKKEITVKLPPLENY